MPKICDMEGVREYCEGFPVELGLDDETGRLIIRATNEGGANCTDIDLDDLIMWLFNTRKGWLTKLITKK